VFNTISVAVQYSEVRKWANMIRMFTKVSRSIFFKINVFYSFDEGTSNDDFNFEWNPNHFYDNGAKKGDLEGATNDSERQT